MKHLKFIEAQLRQKMPPMRPEFKNELRSQLFEKACDQFNPDSKGVSVLSIIFNSMKRHFLVYGSSVAVVLFALTTWIYNPIEPNEVLAQALENYQKEGIYHEKIRDNIYQNEILQNSLVSESYGDRKGNFLYLTRNAQTDAIETVQMTRVSDLGDVELYNNIDQIEELSKIEVSPEQQVWADTFKGEKVYCVQKLAGQEAYGSAAIFIAADDYSVYQLGGELTQRRELDEIEKMVELNRSNESSESYIQSLITNSSYQYSKIKEGSAAYHVFKMPYSNSSVGGISFFIDEKDFKLKKYESYYEENGQKYSTKTEILLSESLDASETESIFNPNAYDGIHRISPAFEGGTIPFKVETDGCFDQKGQMLKKDFFETLPEVTKAAFNRSLMEKRTAIDQYDFFGLDQFDETKELSFDLTKVQMPSKGNILHGFESGSEGGWTFMTEKKKEEYSLHAPAIYAPLGGVVVDVQNDWNAPHGLTILIQHEIEGVEFQTYYGYLVETSVTKGQTVKKGQVIGKMGYSGQVSYFSSNFFLHFELRAGSLRMDPALLWTGKNSSPDLESIKNQAKSFDDEHVFYKNLEYGFSLEFPEVWREYTVKQRPELSDHYGKVLSYDFGLPDQEEIFNISIRSKEAWDLVQQDEGPIPFVFLAERDGNVVTFATAQYAANPGMQERLREISTILESFQWGPQ